MKAFFSPSSFSLFFKGNGERVGIHFSKSGKWLNM
jgi:hypothetical protein